MGGKVQPAEGPQAAAGPWQSAQPGSADTKQSALCADAVYPWVKGAPSGLPQHQQRAASTQSQQQRQLQAAVFSTSSSQHGSNGEGIPAGDGHVDDDEMDGLGDEGEGGGASGALSALSGWAAQLDDVLAKMDTLTSGYQVRCDLASDDMTT